MRLSIRILVIEIAQSEADISFLKNYALFSAVYSVKGKR
jgi:hypothetical protein